MKGININYITQNKHYTTLVCYLSFHQHKVKKVEKITNEVLLLFYSLRSHSNSKYISIYSL